MLGLIFILMGVGLWWLMRKITRVMSRATSTTTGTISNIVSAKRGSDNTHCTLTYRDAADRVHAMPMILASHVKVVDGQTLQMRYDPLNPAAYVVTEWSSARPAMLLVQWGMGAAAVSNMLIGMMVIGSELSLALTGQ